MIKIPDSLEFYKKIIDSDQNINRQVDINEIECGDIVHAYDNDGNLITDERGNCFFEVTGFDWDDLFGPVILFKVAEVK